MGSRSAGRAGFTVVEILVATVSALLLLAAVAQASFFQGRLLRGESRSLERREALRRVLALVARETRAAGHDPLATGSFDGLADGIAVAGGETIEIRSDLHGPAGPAADGEVDLASDERVSFYRSASTRSVTSSSGGQLQGLTSGLLVPAGGLVFRYFDGCGTELVPDPATGLSPADRARVGRIAIALEVRDANGIDRARGETTAVLRNRVDGGCG